MTADTVTRRPISRPSWLSFVRQYPYSNLNESLMKAIYIMKFGRNWMKNDQARVVTNSNRRTSRNNRACQLIVTGPNDRIALI